MCRTRKATFTHNAISHSECLIKDTSSCQPSGIITYKLFYDIIILYFVEIIYILSVYTQFKSHFGYVIFTNEYTILLLVIGYRKSILKHF